MRLHGLLAAATIAGTAGAFALISSPETVAVGAAASVERELRVLHSDGKALSVSPFDRRHLHLSAQDPQKNAKLIVGDRITFGGDGGLKRILEVVAVRHANVHLTGTDAGDPAMLTIVEARDVERPEAPAVRLIVEDGVGPAIAPLDRPERPRAL